MQAVFFEVQPYPGHMGHYFEHVDRLRPVLTQHDGMVWIDRFRPIGRDDALLSHQLWRDETAMPAGGWTPTTRFRNQPDAIGTSHSIAFAWQHWWDTANMARHHRWKPMPILLPTTFCWCRI